MSKSGSYSQILKASSIVGGSQVINMCFGLVRNKLVAILIGPAGVGLIGLFQSIIDLTVTLSGLGLRQSGVRDVANAASGEQQQFGQVVQAVKRIGWSTAIVGGLTLVVFAPWINQITFPGEDYVTGIRLLGLAVFFRNGASCQMALLQGTRRIADIARIAIFAAVSATLISFTFYYTLGIDGIVPALISLAAASLIASSWFVRKVEAPNVSLDWKSTFTASKGMLLLGMSFVWNGLLVGLVAYISKVLIKQDFGIDALGIYSAAFALSGLFVRFVLQAMAADYYPQLSQLSDDHPKMNELVNNQTEIGLLLAFPGLLGTLSVAPFVVQILYSVKFLESSDLLCWFVLGCIGRVISWPMDFTVLAKGKGGLFVITQTAFQLIHLALIYFGLQLFGLIGGAIAYFLLYAIHIPATLLIANRLTGFKWNSAVIGLLRWMFPLAGLSFALTQTCSDYVSLFVGGAVAIGTSLICFRRVVHRVGSNHKIAKLAKQIPGGSWLAGIESDKNS